MRDKIEKVLDNNIDYYGTSKEDLLNELCILFKTKVELPNVVLDDVNNSVCKHKNCNKPTAPKDFDSNYCLYHYDQIN